MGSRQPRIPRARKDLSGSRTTHPRGQGAAACITWFWFLASCFQRTGERASARLWGQGSYTEKCHPFIHRGLASVGGGLLLQGHSFIGRGLSGPRNG